MTPENYCEYIRGLIKLSQAFEETKQKRGQCQCVTKNVGILTDPSSVCGPRVNLHSSVLLQLKQQNRYEGKR